jgi:RNA polymerase sigma-54 factor
MLALQERIEQELAENIVLEQVERRDEPPEVQASTAVEEPPVRDLEQRELVAGSDENNASDFERLDEISKEWPDDNYLPGSTQSASRMQEAGDRHLDMMANTESRPQSLHEYLVEQFAYFDITPELRQFGEYLIHNLDHNGRLPASLPEIVQVYGRSISLPEAEQILSLIQKLEPAGVGARDLKECLLLQLGPTTPLRDILHTLISQHLDDVLQNRLPLIERKTGYSIDTIRAAIEQLSTLDPFPGTRFESQTAEHIIPELRVDKNEEGKYVVEILNEYVPQLRISRSYQKMLENTSDSSTKEFIKKRIDSAKWLIDAIEQRYNTLRKVAQATIDHQTAFLDNGPEHLVPLKMQQIATIVGVHVTTVSRAVDDKYIITPRGIFPLKRFFIGGTKTDEGEDIAWDVIRIRLKELIEKEDKSDPLSDDAIADALAKQGYPLKRRTVTKYRKILNIPSSRQRREY